jgi:DNA-binding PadR family transcriptional regulator
MNTLIFRLSNSLIGMDFWDDKKYQRQLFLTESGKYLQDYVGIISNLLKAIKKVEYDKKELQNIENRRGQKPGGDRRKSILKRASMIFNYHAKIRKAPKVHHEIIKEVEAKSTHDHHDDHEHFRPSKQKGIYCLLKTLKFDLLIVIYIVAEHNMRPRRSVFKPNLKRSYNSKDNIKFKK